MRQRRRRRRSGRLESFTLDVLAAAWLVRGGWRVLQGRLPWQSARR